jgi:hypothetical protein
VAVGSTSVNGSASSTNPMPLTALDWNSWPCRRVAHDDDRFRVTNLGFRVWG